MKNKKIIIAGGTGFIGQSLVQYFGAENDIIVLCRHPKESHHRTTYVRWDGHSAGPWVPLLEGADLLINLAGKSVNCRYTAANKQAIFDSRRESTQALGNAVQQLQNPPAVWINAASATIYRHAMDRPMDEASGEMHNDFSVQVCKLWEQTFNDITVPHTRKVILRIAITLGAENGGVMGPYLNLVKWALGGHQGSGQQMYSWVHIDDICRMIAWAYENPQVEGVYNCASPHPVTNRNFMQTLRATTGNRLGLPAPAWLLKIGAALIGTETELLLKSRWVIPARALAAGYQFKYPDLKPALVDIIRQLPRRRYHLF
ncbi:TIGR01777 family protein [Chitinophaga parva]|uniref:TIGR01777 family protein n=1 Tax=Chitinophaga parva TaxID=2169414 RepID=A0A2T7BN92_9BACT|nr:TIGR01777 family oxidoreductase [Chitinophaga parva]PUZ29136.1 TIGR01777 family protein [Chitinophaga parva]